MEKAGNFPVKSQLLISFLSDFLGSSHSRLPIILKSLLRGKIAQISVFTKYWKNKTSGKLFLLP